MDYYERDEIEAARKVGLALDLPLAVGAAGEFDPWEIFPVFYGSYNAAFDKMAIGVLIAIRDQSDVTRQTLAEEMFREFLCRSALCEYGSSPRSCFPTEHFLPLLQDLIDKWHAYSKVRWDCDVMEMA
ncbi:hypothetical protein [Sphingobium yanoikuyae]|uniref:hypothetical protein n=1 Tax=Sphingobium yanoikuyae TaxID=13690 RepID=UPI00345EC643